jgi:hypothetical protein
MLATTPPMKPAVVTVKTDALIHTFFGRQVSAMYTHVPAAKAAVGQ